MQDRSSSRTRVGNHRTSRRCDHVRNVIVRKVLTSTLQTTGQSYDSGQLVRETTVLSHSALISISCLKTRALRFRDEMLQCTTVYSVTYREPYDLLQIGKTSTDFSQTPHRLPEPSTFSHVQSVSCLSAHQLHRVCVLRVLISCWNKELWPCSYMENNTHTTIHFKHLLYKKIISTVRRHYSLYIQDVHCTLPKQTIMRCTVWCEMKIQ